MIDIVHAFTDKFDETVLIAGLVNPRNNPINENVRVEKIVTYNRSTLFRRLSTWFIGFFQILFLIKWKYRKAHLFLVSNPPLATLIPLFCNNKYSLLIYDVFPDAFTEYNVFSDDGWIVKWWRKANRKIYNKAEHIFAISEGMKELMNQYIAPERITVVPVWTDNDFLKPIPKKDNPFLQDQDLSDKFVIMYSGNLGKSHELKILVELAETMQDEKDIFFLLIGGGDQYETLKQLIAKKKLANIRLLPWQPTEMLPYTLAAADLGVVSLGKGSSLLSMPSKTFNLMSVGCPIMVIADPRSALAKLVDRYELGRHFQTDAVSEIEAFISQLAKDERYYQGLHEKVLLASQDFGPENAQKFANTSASKSE